MSAVINEETGQALEYRDLVKQPDLKEVQYKLLENKIGRLAEGMWDIEDTNTIYFVQKSEILKNRLKEVTCGKIVMDYKLNKLKNANKNQKI